MVVLGAFKGLLMGARRIAMTSKRGNRRFYKGRGAKSAGSHTNKGHYLIKDNKIPEIVVPQLDGFKLKPYVSQKTPYVIGKPLTPQDILELAKPNNSI